MRELRNALREELAQLGAGGHTRGLRDLLHHELASRCHEEFVCYTVAHMGTLLSDMRRTGTEINARPKGPVGPAGQCYGTGSTTAWTWLNTEHSGVGRKWKQPLANRKVDPGSPGDESSLLSVWHTVGYAGPDGWGC